MFRYSTKILFFFGILMAITEGPVFCRCLKYGCNYGEEFSFLGLDKGDFLKGRIYALDNRKLIKKELIYEVLVKNIRIEKFLAKLVSEKSDEPQSTDFVVEIESDINYVENNKYIAEGNVIVFLKSGTLKTDKLVYDRDNKLTKLFGNIIFEKGNQFFKADYLEFYTDTETGYVENIYGVIDFNAIQNDLNFKIKKSNQEKCNIDLDLQDLPSKVSLLSENNIRFKNKFDLASFKLDFDEITTWRFRSKKINITKNGWNSDEIFITNDPYNKPQAVIRSKDFSGEIIDGKNKIISKSTFLRLDDKLTIPLGRQTISNQDLNNLGWGIGYERDEKDGFYLIRNFNGIDLNDNFMLLFKPYFLIERAYRGETTAFREKGSFFTSENVTYKADFLDYIALDTLLKGEIFNWDFAVNTKLKSINPDRFYDSLSGDFNLKRNFYKEKRFKNSIKDEDICKEDKFGKPVQIVSVDGGFYGNYHQGDLYKGFGSTLIGEYFSSDKYKSSDYSISLDVGKFEGKALEGNDLIAMERYGINASLSKGYKLISFNNNNDQYDKNFRFYPEKIDQGIYFISALRGGLFEYSNGKSQSVLTLSSGPELKFGEFKKRFLDYTYISIKPEYIMKKAQSPFKFDNFKENSRINFDFKQQIYGPLIFGFSSYLNIQENSPDYWEMEDKKYTFGVSRRSYSLNATYSFSEKKYAIEFKLYNFGYRNRSNSF